MRLPAILIVLIAACGLSATAQQVQPPPASLPAQDAAPLAVGQSLFPLYGPWKFHVGDSPIDPVTHAPVWASPAFDDTQWETVSLAPEADSDDSPSGDAEYVTGWTAKGHPNYWGYAWYRIELHFAPSSGQSLALAGPADVDDAYQLFANGQYAGGFGNFDHPTPVTFYNQPMMFALPHPQPDSRGASTMIIAFRVWMDRRDLVNSDDAGGFHSAPVVGEQSAISAAHRLKWQSLLRHYSPFMIDAFLFGLLGVVAFSLILFDPNDRVYLWMGAVFFTTALYSALSAFDVWTQHLSSFSDLLITQCFLGPLAYAGWAMVWWVWFGRQRPLWSPVAASVLAFLYMISNAISLDLFFSFIPHSVASAFEIVSLIVRLLFFIVLFWIVIQGVRRQGIEGWLVLPAIILLGIGLFQNELAFLHIQLNWFPFGVWVTLVLIANLLLVATVALLLLRRLLQSVRRQRLIMMDARRAQLQSDFVAAVSHEFRSPLTTLRTITDLLVEDRLPDDARRRQSYAFLDRETTRLQRLVEDLLDFGRMESGRKQDRMGIFDAFQIVRAAVADVSEQAANNGFQLEVNLASGGAAVRADEEAFRRAVRNLVENAMKYSTDRRTVWIEGLVGNRQVSISVRDQGMGIDPMEQQAIFEKFVRGDAAKKAGIKGTGIGLAMVKEITEAMGGQIHLESEVGSGSTFTIVVPQVLE